MVFLPDKMQRQSAEVVDDSDDSGDLDTDAEESVEEKITKASKQEGRKRSSDIINEEPDSEHDDSIANPSKRRCKTVSSKNHRRARCIRVSSDNEEDGEDNTNRERTLRRQSTMTQIVDGRKPLPGVEVPDFKPVKKTPRLSWSGKGKSSKKSQDQKQRTLTQMVPGMRPLEIMSDDDLIEALSEVETEDKYDQAYGDAVAKRLAQQGLHQTGDNNGENLAIVKAGKHSNPKSTKKEERDNPTVDSQDITESVVQSVEDDCDDSYQPTQFIEAPSRRLNRATRRNTRGQASKPGEASDASQKPNRSTKTRFSLLSTPEKRRVREIPSSQSPADSPISTQVTPHKPNRSPLKQCMSNPNNAAAETPSKRKQVTFDMPSKTPMPPKLRRFESTIQDSEDEDDDITEDDSFLPRRSEQGFDGSVGVSVPGKNIGADTQRMLDEIDRACDEANATGDTIRPGSSPELGDPLITRGYNESSPELGEVRKQSPGYRERAVQEEQQVDYDKSTRIKQEFENEDEDDKHYTEDPSALMKPLHAGTPLKDDATISIKAEPLAHMEQLHSSPPTLDTDFQDTFLSPPMILPDDSSDEERSIDRDPTPPRSSRRPLPQPTSADIQQSANHDDESVQVPRSPSLQHESQQSNSSKAEQQLQDEWLSYSQYVTVRPLASSSVRAVPDAFSYDATPRPPQKPAPPPPQHQSSEHLPSQATTVDEITQRTPRTKRTQHISSTHTTPHRIASSQPIFPTPSKLPRLFIPSSFPSPGKTDTNAEEWSSPVMGMRQDVARGNYKSSQWASIEDFSIPPPPPGEEGEEDE